MCPQSSNFDVVVVGDSTVDLIFTGLPQFPELGKDTIGTGFTMTPGEAYIPAVAMHRLGIHVGWATDFGNDQFSQYILKQARSEGLDETFFIHHDRPLQRISVAVSFPQDRAFITYYDRSPSHPAALKALTKASARAVYIPGLYHGPYLALLLPLIRTRRMKIIMDGNSSDGTLENRAIKKAIRRVDVFLPNLAEALRLTGSQNIQSAISRLAELCPLVVLKAGSDGSYACVGKQLMYAPPVQINPIDTTGAGDTFNAGFVCAWLDGLPMETCLQWGNICGALSTTAMGGTGRVITRADIAKYQS